MQPEAYESSARQSGQIGQRKVFPEEAVILTAVYYIAPARVLRQLAECLQAGYPEQVMYYGYEVIKSGSLHGSAADQKGTEL